MSDPIKNEAAGGPAEGPTTPSPRSLRRKRAQGIVEPESKVERPATVAVFQASPTSIAGVLAKHGVALDATLAWSRGGPSILSPAAPSTAAPVFIVGAGREFLAELLDGHPVLKVGFHGDALANMTRAVEGNWGRLAPTRRRMAGRSCWLHRNTGRRPVRSYRRGSGEVEGVPRLLTQRRAALAA